MPYWVNIESWHSEGCSDQEVNYWAAAARSLRSTLAHASLWRDGNPHGSRLLTRQDVQSLPDCLEQDGVPSISQPPRGSRKHGIAYYSRRFREDEELAQCVADAWNAVVERGEADVVNCGCAKCKTRL